MAGLERRRRSPPPRPQTSRSCCRSAMPPAIGAMSWRMRASRTRRSPAQMNELFVNIKVDREERPDLDAIYQHALALMGEQGGWPLTMFLTPDGEPFWGGTYFPPEPRWGRPGFPQVLDAIEHGLPARPRQGHEECRRVARGAATARPAGSAARAIAPELLRPHRRAAVARGRPLERRHRHCAEIPADAASSNCCGAPGSAPASAPYREAV